jgi:hypothetical protein
VGAKSVTVTKSEFLQKGGVGMNVTPIPNKAVVVSFVLPPPAQRARVNGQLHLRWEGCPLPCQAYVPGTAIGNAKVASKTLVLEDTQMNRRIMQQLPGEKRQLYGRVLKEMRTKTPSPVADTLRPLGLSARDVERTVRGLPSVRITPDTDKRRHKQEVLYRLKINPQQLEMRPMEGMTPMAAHPMEPAAPMAAHPMERMAPEQIRELPSPSKQVTPSVQERR